MTKLMKIRKTISRSARRTSSGKVTGRKRTMRASSWMRALSSTCRTIHNCNGHDDDRVKREETAGSHYHTSSTTFDKTHDDGGYDDAAPCSDWPANKDFVGV